MAAAAAAAGVAPLRRAWLALAAELRIQLGFSGLVACGVGGRHSLVVSGGFFGGVRAR